MSVGWVIVIGSAMLMVLVAVLVIARHQSRLQRELDEDERRIWGDWEP